MINSIIFRYYFYQSKLFIKQTTSRNFFLSEKCTVDIDCRNGGNCKASGNFKFCDCLLGTTGDICETVDECERDPAMCNGESKCTYDIAREKAFCQCLDDAKKYDPLDQSCKGKYYIFNLQTVYLLCISVSVSEFSVSRTQKREFSLNFFCFFSFF